MPCLRRRSLLWRLADDEGLAPFDRYGPANFQTETIAMVVWCHNKIEPCQIKIDGVKIGDSAVHNASSIVES